MTTPIPPSPCATANPAARPGPVAVLVAIAVTLTAGPAGAADDPALDQTVEADEAMVDDGAVIDTGHVDLGPRFVDGDWQLQARDDRHVPPVWRDPHDVVIHLPDQAIIAAPDSDDYAFLGVEPDTPLHVIPQTQDPEVVWLGWNTQDPDVTRRIVRGATLTLHAVDGPGQVFLFLQEGVTGPPNVLWDSTQPFPQDLWMQVDTHTHGNWVFTEPGVYHLDVEVHADLADEEHASDTATLQVAVGSDTDPAILLDATAPDVAATADRASQEQPDARTATPDATTSTMPRVLAAIGVSSLILISGIVAVIVAGRRTRRRARHATPPPPDVPEQHP